jgi:hypothetical protein
MNELIDACDDDDDENDNHDHGMYRIECNT